VGDSNDPISMLEYRNSVKTALSTIPWSLGTVDGSQICRQPLVLLVSSDIVQPRESSVNVAEWPGICDPSLRFGRERGARRDVCSTEISEEGLLSSVDIVSLGIVHDDMCKAVLKAVPFPIGLCHRHGEAVRVGSEVALRRRATVVVKGRRRGGAIGDVVIEVCGQDVSRAIEFGARCFVISWCRHVRHDLADRVWGQMCQYLRVHMKVPWRVLIHCCHKSHCVKSASVSC
jgi:hypothetical protein